MGGIRTDAITGSNCDGIGSTSAGIGSPGQGGGSIAIIGKGHTTGQSASLADRHARVLREAGGRDRERPGAADGEGGVVGAGNGRSLVDGQGEGLGGIRTDAVAGGNRDRIGCPGASIGSPSQGGCAVVIVGKGYAAGQGASLTDDHGCAGWKAGGGDRERPGAPDGEGRVIRAGNGWGLVDSMGYACRSRAGIEVGIAGVSGS